LPASRIFINSQRKFQFHFARGAHKHRVIVCMCGWVKYVCIINAHFTLKCTGTHTSADGKCNCIRTHTRLQNGDGCDAFSAICFEPRFVFNCCMANSICMCLCASVCLCGWECNARLKVGNVCLLCYLFAVF